ncbi:glycerol-3-phosphate responsive antiterminator [Frigoribacterium sp. 2-23]|uniref:glycerol-3-phosphate responsive antiterminator n=1 Tax=Frigoribacterium sp. 2-23 TaxID=3415006 RepID=UPI003C701125
MSSHAPTTTPRAELVERLADDPVVASVTDEAQLRAVLRSDRLTVFVLFGDVLTIESIVGRLVAAGKTVFVNVDLLDGFASREVVVRFVREKTEARGVLSSKAPLVKAARALGLIAIHRFFLIDSLSYRNLPKQVQASQADAVEILPGCMPRVISWLRDDVDLPIIAGGLVCDKDDVMAALGAGAVAVASSNVDVWSM